MPSSLLLAAAAGLAAGALHVWTGPDHMAALLPLSFGRRGRAAWLGARWGLGHSAGVVLVAMVGVALRGYLEIGAISSVAERLVGVMLIALGAWGIRLALRMKLHAHPHTHDGRPHAHLHVHAADPHDPDAAVQHPPVHAHRHVHAALLAGTLHGLAGASHFWAVLPALALPGWRTPLGYLAAFALGTVIAMALFAGAVGMTSAWVSVRRGERLARRLCAGAGAVTMCVGVVWLVLPLAGLPLP